MRAQRCWCLAREVSFLLSPEASLALSQPPKRQTGERVKSESPRGEVHQGRRDSTHEASYLSSEPAQPLPSRGLPLIHDTSTGCFSSSTPTLKQLLQSSHEDPLTPEASLPLRWLHQTVSSAEVWARLRQGKSRAWARREVSGGGQVAGRGDHAGSEAATGGGSDGGQLSSAQPQLLCTPSSRGGPGTVLASGGPHVTGWGSQASKPVVATRQVWVITRYSTNS